MTREIPERPAATPPSHLIYWQTLFRHHVHQRETFGGCVMWGDSPVPPTKYLIQRAPKVLVGRYAESRSISTFQEWLFLQVLSLTTYYLQELFLSIASVSSSSNKQHRCDAINPPLPPPSPTIQLLGTFNGWRVQTSHTMILGCMWISYWKQW